MNVTPPSICAEKAIPLIQVTGAAGAAAAAGAAGAADGAGAAPGAGGAAGGSAKAGIARPVARQVARNNELFERIRFCVFIGFVHVQF